jgi:protoporphyrinogen IX oxidase
MNNSILWFKVFHIISIVAWFSGLFYLPRLFVYHASSDDSMGERFTIMEGRLFYIIMLPAAISTIVFGILLLCYAPHYYLHARWFYLKLICVAALVLFHIYCGILYRDFKHKKNKHSRIFYRFINEIPTLLLFAIVILTILKP